MGGYTAVQLATSFRSVRIRVTSTHRKERYMLHAFGTHGTSFNNADISILHAGRRARVKLTMRAKVALRARQT